MTCARIAMYSSPLTILVLTVAQIRQAGNGALDFLTYLVFLANLIPGLLAAWVARLLAEPNLELMVPVTGFLWALFSIAQWRWICRLGHRLEG